MIPELLVRLVWLCSLDKTRASRETNYRGWPLVLEACQPLVKTSNVLLDPVKGTLATDSPVGYNVQNRDGQACGERADITPYDNWLCIIRGRG